MRGACAIPIRLFYVDFQLFAHIFIRIVFLFCYFLQSHRQWKIFFLLNYDIVIFHLDAVSVCVCLCHDNSVVLMLAYAKITAINLIKIMNILSIPVRLSNSTIVPTVDQMMKICAHLENRTVNQLQMVYLLRETPSKRIFRLSAESKRKHNHSTRGRLEYNTLIRHTITLAFFLA